MVISPACSLTVTSTYCATLDVVGYVTGYINSHSLLQYGLLFIVYSTLTRVIARSKTQIVCPPCPLFVHYVLCLSHRVSRYVKGRQTDTQTER